MQRASTLRRALATSSTAGAFTAYIPTITEPSGAGVFPFDSALNPGCQTPDLLNVMFFGAGSDNTAFNARIIGWERLADSTVKTLWIPKILATFTCTRSAMVGVTGCHIVSTDRVVDTLVPATVGPQPNRDGTISAAAALFGTVQIYNPANDLAAWALVPLYACEKIQFDFALTAGTDMNALFRFIRNRTD